MANQILSTLVVRMTLNAASYTTGMMNALGLAQSWQAQTMAAGAALTRFVTLPLVTMGIVGAKEFGKFNKAMAQSLSIMEGVSPKLQKEMEDQAKSMSASSVSGPDELAKSYYYLAQTGLNAEASMKSLGVVNRFAVAGMMDQQVATDKLSDAQTALGLTVRENAEANSRNMLYLSDRIVKASTISNASIEQLSDSLTTKSAAAMRLFGRSTEEGLAVLAAFSDQGQKGQNAGNLYDRALRLLTKAALDNAGAHKALGFSVYDANGNMRNMADIVDNLDNIMMGMSSEQRAATLTMLGFEARSQQAITPLLGMGDAIRQYEAALRQADGYTATVSEKTQNNFIDQLTILWNRIKVVSIEIGERLAPMISWIGERIAGAYETWSLLPEWLKTTTIYIGAFVAAVGPMLVAIAGIATAFTVVAGLLAGTGALQVGMYLLLTVIVRMTAAATPYVLVLILIADAYRFINEKVVGATKALEDYEKTQERVRAAETSRFQKQAAELAAIADARQRQLAVDKAIAEKQKELETAGMRSVSADAKYQSALQETESGSLSSARAATARALFGADENTPLKMDAEEAKQTYERVHGELLQLEEMKKNADSAVASGGFGNAFLDSIKNARGSDMIEMLDSFQENLKKTHPMFGEIASKIAGIGKDIKSGMKWSNGLIKDASRHMARLKKEHEERIKAEQEEMRREIERKNEELRRQREEWNRAYEDAQKGDSKGARENRGSILDTFSQLQYMIPGVTGYSQIASEEEQAKPGWIWGQLHSFLASRSEKEDTAMEEQTAAILKLGDSFENISFEGIELNI